ncbi:cell division protein FtsQ/DivIB [Granulicella arctica]|uniref:cell division protein FtsQ/DivIB n=1 Tax=Granulicella arctica TaxID=940613 RepID=UPI0021E0780C|nr:FtsQ-type POTRA domain-containing protein [Granulicella arctica]
MLDEPEQDYAPSSSRSGAPRRASSRTPANPRHDYGEDFAGEYDGARPPDESRPRQRSLKLKVRTRVPQSLAGRIATGLALLLILGTGIALLMLTRTFLLHDSRFMIHSRSAIEIQGNKHLTQAQLLDIFGDDIDRNIFRVSLTDRQAELEALPWVQHATLMRLLPGRLRVSVVERIPVAFVRQGSHIGLVDGNGVLLDMAPSGTAAQTEPHYSFPVVSGLSANDPASTRAARMKIYERFRSDLDSSGEKVSEVLSDVDLSNPEDVKALIPANSSEILVHFGDDHFLERYRRFQEHLPTWHTQYPNLASVDMRYEREVVLDMAGSAAAKADVVTNVKPATPTVKPVAAVPHPAIVRGIKKAPVKPTVHPLVKASSHKPVGAPKAKPHAAAPVSKPVVKPATPAAAIPVASAPQPAASSASAAARSGYLAKPAAGKPAISTVPSHAPQVPSR